MAEHMPRNKTENGSTGVCKYVSIRRKTRTRTGIQNNSGKVLSPGDRGEKHSKQNSSTFLFFSFNDSLFANFSLLTEDDFFEFCGLIHIVGMKIMITDVTSMLVQEGIWQGTRTREEAQVSLRQPPRGNCGIILIGSEFWLETHLYSVRKESQLGEQKAQKL